MAECSIVYDYDADEVRMYFTRKADWKHCIAKLDKSQGNIKDYQQSSNEEEDSYFITLSIKYSSAPKSMIRGLPRGISKVRKQQGPQQTE